VIIAKRSGLSLLGHLVSKLAPTENNADLCSVSDDEVRTSGMLMLLLSYQNYFATAPLPLLNRVERRSLVQILPGGDAIAFFRAS
jgi:hypothetical protein